MPADNPELSLHLKAELERLQTTRPLGEYIDGLLDGLNEKIRNIARSNTVQRFPCRLCAGAGFLLQSGQVNRVMPDGAIEPVSLPNGSSIVIATPHMCPRCLGVQFDIEDMCATYAVAPLEKTRRVAA